MQNILIRYTDIPRLKKFFGETCHREQWLNVEYWLILAILLVDTFGTSSRTSSVELTRCQTPGVKQQSIYFIYLLSFLRVTLSKLDLMGFEIPYYEVC
jgi:hypothetical protein